jgi:sRNA-binding protein
MFCHLFPFTREEWKQRFPQERSNEWRTIMTKKIFALVILSMSLAACEPAGTENNMNANSNARPNNPTASPEASPAVRPQLKAGDKVKVTINGSAADATVVSVDEKSGKATVKVANQKEEKTVAIADIIKN